MLKQAGDLAEGGFNEALGLWRGFCFAYESGKALPSGNERLGSWEKYVD